MSALDSEARQRLLDAAEALFTARGYDSVRLRDIAEVLGVKHAALYYHVPGGKEQLYVEVMERSFARHRAGMEDAIANAGPALQDQLMAVAAWLLSQPAVNILRVQQTDFHAISPAHVQRLSDLMFDALRIPVEKALNRAQAAGITALEDTGLAAISFVTLVETIHAIDQTMIEAVKLDVIKKLLDMLLFGWLKR
jgi:AcrR family transcriptional regulator